MCLLEDDFSNKLVHERETERERESARKRNGKGKDERLVGDSGSNQRVLFEEAK